MEDKLEKIHETALKILKDIGINLLHPEVLDLVQQKGVKVSGKRAFLKPEQVMHWVHKAPSKFTLYAKNPKNNTVIGDDNVLCSPGYGCAQIIMADGNRRDSLLSDYIAFAKLTHQCEDLNLNGGILAQPCDVPSDKSHLIMLYAAIFHSDKCLIGMPAVGEKMQEIMDMMALLCGGKERLIQKPRILIPISIHSPLQIDEMSLQAMLVTARHGQAMNISPAPAAGTTGPISLAGNLALANAETLAGIAVAQMISEGTPVLFGLQASIADLKTGKILIGSPAFNLQGLYGARLARKYGLPIRGSGNTTDANWISVQSGYESMMSMLVAFQNKVNVIVHSAGILDAFAAMSYEKYLVDLEIIRSVKSFLHDIEISEDNLSIDVIKEVGPGGEFLTTLDTLNKVRTHTWNSELHINEQTLDRPLNDQLIEVLHAKLQRMLDSFQKPGLDADVQNQLERYLVQAGVDHKIIDAIKKKERRDNNDLWQSRYGN
ncbi:MAG: trimethylamine methyltransferase family protein [Desulfobacteraceae bacterium]